MPILFVTAPQIIEEALKGLEADAGFETEPGFCWRWTRQVLEASGVPSSEIAPRGSDARMSYQWYCREGYCVPIKNGSVPGDVLFYEGRGHGPHGHVGIRVPGNFLAENSSVHWEPDADDARGKRPLVEVGRPVAIVRLWKEV